jgi:group I intron endonuclease
MLTNSVLIYKIENVANGHSYVGSTVEPRRRWNTHRNSLRANKHTSPFLQQAWNKHKEAVFVYRPLLVCSVGQRAMYEDIAIKAMGHYNLLKDSCLPMPGAMTNKKHTELALQNLSAGAKKRWSNARKNKYDPLCEKAWQLVLTGVPRYKAAKQIGVSYDTFWRWLAENNKRQGVRGRFKQPVA